jgi:DNA-binding response OmpR family regulator
MILPQQQALLSRVKTEQAKVCIVDARAGDYQCLLEDRRFQGVEWEFVSTGSAALHIAQREKIALWVVNVRLPDRCGLDLCQMLKSHAADAVVYLLTDEYSAAQERAAWLAGASLFRPKPIDPTWFERLSTSPARTKAV